MQNAMWDSVPFTATAYLSSSYVVARKLVGRKWWSWCQTHGGQWRWPWRGLQMPRWSNRCSAKAVKADSTDISSHKTSLVSLMNAIYQVLFHCQQSLFLSEWVDDHKVGDNGEEGEPHVGEHHDGGLHQGRGEHMAQPLATFAILHLWSHLCMESTLETMILIHISEEGTVVIVVNISIFKWWDSYLMG